MNFGIFTKPSRYINQEINALRKTFPPKETSRGSVTVALAFPDLYEIGMSHLGLKILYKIINDAPFASAERVFAPWEDREKYLRGKGEPLSSLETGIPLREFDVVGFSLQYELSYPAILNMLDLGHIPLKRQDRGKSDPLVIAGGPCSVNPMPLSNYIDAFVVGDAEETIVEIIHRVREKGKRDALLKELSKIPGVFVPEYSFGPVQRMFIRDLDAAPYPTAPVVPYMKTVHDRINIEVSRGCTMGCRFCQAGMIYRPVRERSPEKVLALAGETIRNTGYDEVSFTSLSAGDYSQMVPLLKQFNRLFKEERVAVSLPSLRVGAVDDAVLEEIKAVRKSGFTMAPEAGTERLRCVINKDFQEDRYEAALDSLFRAGWQTIKLYFMIGLPTETWEDVQAIIRMAHKARTIASRHQKGRISINVGISPFVPKPHTPFQWTGQEDLGQLREKKMAILKGLSKRVFTVKSHDEKMSLLEAAIARGDEKVGAVIEQAWREGARLDAWSECLDFDRWKRAMEKTGTDLQSVAMAAYSSNDLLPWDIIHVGVKKEYLFNEFQQALQLRKTPDCGQKCHACGLQCRSREFLKPGEYSLPPEQTAIPTRKFSPVRVRAEFAKSGTLRYLSHLELMAALERGLRRARVPLGYSEGFHPSPRISFGPALGVGIEGDAEYFDMEVYPPFDIEAYHCRINDALPQGIRVKYMAFIGNDIPSLNSFIDSYEYMVTFPDELPVRKYLSMAEGESRYQPLVMHSAIMDSRTIRLFLRESAHQKVRIMELLREFFGVALEEVSVRRTGQWGFLGKPVSPMEIQEIAELTKATGERERGMKISAGSEGGSDVQ